MTTQSDMTSETQQLAATIIICNLCGEFAEGEWLQHRACIRARYSKQPDADRFNPNLRGWRRCNGCRYSYLSTTVSENGCGNCHNQLPGAEQQEKPRKTKKTVVPA